jgi:hypothetical protein
MQPRSRFRRWMPLIAIVAASVLAFSIYFHEKPFADRKAVLEQVVEEIRLMHLKPGVNAEARENRAGVE